MMQLLKGIPHYILVRSTSFSLCGTMFHLKSSFAGDMAARDASDQHASISWASIHRIFIDTRDDFAIIDFINEIGQLRLMGYS